MTLSPVAERAHGNQTYVALRAVPFPTHDLANSTRYDASAVVIGIGAMPPRTQLHAYVLSLAPESAKVGRLRRRLSTPGVRISVAVLRGVRASDALAVAGVSPDRARAVFGSQVNEVEFLGALGCALSHLRAARRAIRDGASPALILEEDAVLDLQPLWTARSIAHFVDALPNEWEIVQLAIVARQREWDELRTSWRRAATHLGSSQLLRRDFYWSSAAYLLHERGAQRLLARFRAADANASSAADNVAAARWRLGTDHVPCVKADLCVLYPSLPPASTFVAAPPLFTCAERGGSSQIAGHDVGDQRGVHVLSRHASFDFASEAALREETSSRGQRGNSSAAASAALHGHALAQAPSLAAPLPRQCSGGPAVLSTAAGPPVDVPEVAPHDDRVEWTYVLRRPSGPPDVVKLHRARRNESSGALLRLDNGGQRFVNVGTWRAEERALSLQWTSTAAPPHGALHSFCRTDQAGNGSPHTYYSDGNATLLTPLLPPPLSSSSPVANASAHGVGRPRVWVHDAPALWWRPLLQCTPEWDVGMDSQNSAEVWLLMQLLSHPARVHDWRAADVIYLPLLPKTSLHAGRCLGTDHRTRLRRALAAMMDHPAYHRRSGHDHVVLSNYWDAWGAFGPRGSATHAALANVSFGWHETQDAAWGMANHRHVGKCQIALPYVETPECARRTAAELAATPRTTPVYFAGAVDDFDTEPDHRTCPNVAHQAIAVRRALMSVALDGAILQRMPHNLRACNGSATCERSAKRDAAKHYAASRVCPVAAGDTPSSGRLYDAIACLCVPLIASDDIQLPFPHVADAPNASHGYGLRVAASQVINAPQATVADAMRRASSLELQRTLVQTRHQLAYRTRRSSVAEMALRELWASCLQRGDSSAQPAASVAKC